MTAVVNGIIRRNKDPLGVQYKQYSVSEVHNTFFILPRD